MDARHVRRVWGDATVAGRDHGVRPLAQRLYPRRGCTVNRARRAALYMLQALPPSKRYKLDGLPLAHALDVWMLGAFERRAGVVHCPRVPATTARAACDEMGACAARVALLLGNAKLSWPLLTASREASGGMKRQHRNPHRTENVISPMEARQWLDGRKHRTLSQRRDAAAVALASTIGPPVTMTSHLRCAEIVLAADTPVDRIGVVVNYQVRPEGGLKVRRATTTAPTEVIRTAASSYAIDKYLVPWVRERRAAGDEYLFPRIETIPRARTVGSQHVATTELEALAKSVKAGCTWHTFRFGVARALVGVHTVDGGPRDAVRLEVKNVIQLRSNARLLGSNDAYVLDDIDPVFEATRALDRVPVVQVAGMLSSTGQVVPVAGEDLETGTCWRCQAFIARDQPGYLCDVLTCTAMVGSCCVTAQERSGQLRCPQHES